jgi:hypothetical protein
MAKKKKFKLKFQMPDTKKVITTILVILSLIGGVLALNDRYVSAKEFTKELARQEQQTVQSLQEFKKDMALDRLQTRANALSDRLLDLRIQMKKNPNDKELKELYDNTYREQEKVRDQMEKSK